MYCYYENIIVCVPGQLLILVSTRKFEGHTHTIYIEDKVYSYTLN